MDMAVDQARDWAMAMAQGLVLAMVFGLMRGNYEKDS